MCLGISVGSYVHAKKRQNTYCVEVSNNTTKNDSVMTDTTVVDKKNRIATDKKYCGADSIGGKTILFFHTNPGEIPVNDKNFRIRYNSFKEKMKEPWIGDIIKQIIFK